MDNAGSKEGGEEEYIGAPRDLREDEGGRHVRSRGDDVVRRALLMHEDGSCEDLAGGWERREVGDEGQSVT